MVTDGLPVERYYGTSSNVTSSGTMDWFAHAAGALDDSTTVIGFVTASVRRVDPATSGDGFPVDGSRHVPTFPLVMVMKPAHGPDATTPELEFVWYEAYA